MKTFAYSLFTILILSGCGTDALTALSPTLSLTFFLQDGHLGYSGTTDTTIYKVPSGSNPTPGTNAQLFAQTQFDTSTGSYALFRFDLEPVKKMISDQVAKYGGTLTITDCASQLVVSDAVFHVFAVASAPFGNSPAMTLDFFKSTAPLFTEADATWANANATQPWDASTVGSLTSFHDIDLGYGIAHDMPASSFGYWEEYRILRRYAQSWLCDATTNKGMALGINSGGTTTTMSFFSREVVEKSFRPMLELKLQIFAKAGDSATSLQAR